MHNKAYPYLGSSTVRRALAGVVLAALGYVGYWASAGMDWSWRDFIGLLVASVIPAVLAISGRRGNRDRPLRLRTADPPLADLMLGHMPRKRPGHSDRMILPFIVAVLSSCG